MRKNVRWMSWCLSMVACFSLAGLVGCELGDDGGDSALSIDPLSSSYLATGSTNIAFSASGGVPPYTWSVNDPGLGALVSVGENAIYTGYAVPGLNFVIVTDVQSNSVAATVTQE